MVSQHHFVTYFLLKGLLKGADDPRVSKSVCYRDRRSLNLRESSEKGSWWWLCLSCAAHSAQRRPSVPEGRGPVREGVCHFWPRRDERGSGEGCSHCWVCGDHCRGESSAAVILPSLLLVLSQNPHSSDLTGSWSNPEKPNSEKTLFSKICPFFPLLSIFHCYSTLYSFTHQIRLQKYGLIIAWQMVQYGAVRWAIPSVWTTLISCVKKCNLHRQFPWELRSLMPKIVHVKKVLGMLFNFD